MDINTEQTSIASYLVSSASPKESHAALTTEYPVVRTHGLMTASPIGAIRLDGGGASGFPLLPVFGGFTRSGVAENDRCAVSAKASYNSRADTTTSPKTSTDLLRNSIIRMSFYDIVVATTICVMKSCRQGYVVMTTNIAERRVALASSIRSKPLKPLNTYFIRADTTR